MSRSAASLPILPPRKKVAPGRTSTEVEEAASAYRGRGYAVGTLAFGAEADLETVSTLVSAFFRAFCPPSGLRVRASRGPRVEVLPSRFTPTASVRASQLARGGAVELTAGDFDEPRPGAPLFWIASRLSGDTEMHVDDGEVPLSAGFCIVRPGPERPDAEAAIAHALSTVVEAAAEVAGCLSAIATAQGTPITRARELLPYEELAGTSASSNDDTWRRARVRSPGWRVLVPQSCVGALSKPPTSVALEHSTAGVVVKMKAATPFAVDATDDVEQWLLPLLGPLHA